MKTDNATLIAALRILANDIQSEDGIANACIAEAADRIEELIAKPDGEDVEAIVHTEIKRRRAAGRAGND